MSVPPVTPPDTAAASDFKVDTYEAVIREITKDDIGLLHELTVGVFWPHRRRDLAFFTDLGRGFLALDMIGRPIASAMRFPGGDGLTMFGMMVTAPRLQSHGTGRQLLTRLMDLCDGSDFRLSATRSGYRLYAGAGFKPLTTIRQHQGIAREIYRPEPPKEVAIRPLEDRDLAELRALDSVAYGGTRSAVLDRLLSMSRGVVAEREGAICGYALMRPFGRGEAIGPVVADDDLLAMSLAAPLIERCKGQFLRLDTPDQGERFGAFLSAAGLGVFDTVTEMYRGTQRRPLEGMRVYGLATQSLG